MIKTLTDENFMDELAPHKVAVVKVYASWCGPCKFMKAAYQRYAKTFAEYEGVKIPFYEIDHDKNPEFIQRFGTVNLPTFAFFVHGIMIFKIEGITRTKVVEEVLKRALKAPVGKGNWNGKTGERQDTGDNLTTG